MTAVQSFASLLFSMINDHSSICRFNIKDDNNKSKKSCTTIYQGQGGRTILTAAICGNTIGEDVSLYGSQTQLTKMTAKWSWNRILELNRENTYIYKHRNSSQNYFKLAARFKVLKVVTIVSQKWIETKDRMLYQVILSLWILIATLQKLIQTCDQSVQKLIHVTSIP